MRRLALAVLLAGCAPSAEYRIDVERLPDATMRIAEAAAAEWNAACGTNIVVGRDNGGVLLRVTDIPHGLLGLAIEPDLYIFIDHDAAGDMQSIVAHEMGHAVLNLRDGDRGIMDTARENGTRVTPDDCP